jgi:hypothetical protein
MAGYLESTLVALVHRVVGEARRAGLAPQDQRDAATAVLMAAMPSEAPAIAHIFVELVFPRIATTELAA